MTEEIRVGPECLEIGRESAGRGRVEPRMVRHAARPVLGVRWPYRIQGWSCRYGHLQPLSSQVVEHPEP